MARFELKISRISASKEGLKECDEAGKYNKIVLTISGKNSGLDLKRTLVETGVGSQGL